MWYVLYVAVANKTSNNEYKKPPPHPFVSLIPIIHCRDTSLSYGVTSQFRLVYISYK